MTAAREQILGKIRASLGRGRLTVERAAELEAALAKPRPGTVPGRGRPPAKARVDIFRKEAERVDATVDVIENMGGIPSAIKSFLDSNKLPPFLKIAPEPSLQAVPWSEEASLEAAFGPAQAEDSAALSRAFAGVAESGTLVMASGPGSPQAMNFLPETHIAALSAGDIVGSYEDAWARLRKSDKGGIGGQFMPRAVTWITGPSRTADIEQELLLGAHGPRRLHILIILSGQ
jgi:L-lactate dehydrogenase complex protein LldG